MLDNRRTLRLSLALNIILVLSSSLAFLYFMGDKSLTDLPKDWRLNNFLCGPTTTSHPKQQQLEVLEPVTKTVTVDKVTTQTTTVEVEKVVTKSEPRCDVCTSGDAGKALCAEFGPDLVGRTMAFTQGNTRLRRVLAKWRQGQPVRLGALGGSNSAGQGVWKDNQMIYSQLNMHILLFNYLDERFPQSGGKVMEHVGEANQNSFVNGAQPGKGTDYFSMCSQLHIPDDTDLIVLEFAVNDQFKVESSESYEMMVRYLIERPNSPALIELQTFGYEFHQLITGGGSHLATDLYYNIPTIAPRPLFNKIAQTNVTKFWDWFYWYNPHERPKDLHGVDLRHIGPGGHRMFAEFTKAYIDQQLCEMDHIEAVAGHKDIDKLYPLEPIQKLSLFSAFHRDDSAHFTPKVAPKCQSIDSDSHPLAPSANEGFEKWTWRNEETGKEKHYMRATKPGSKIAFNLGMVMSRVDLFHLRSKSFGLGNARCTLKHKDKEGKDKSDTITVEGYWDRSENVGQVARWRVPTEAASEATLECEVLQDTKDPGGGTEFRIIAVMSL